MSPAVADWIATGWCDWQLPDVNTAGPDGTEGPRITLRLSIEGRWLVTADQLPSGLSGYYPPSDAFADKPTGRADTAEEAE